MGSKSDPMVYVFGAGPAGLAAAHAAFNLGSSVQVFEASAVPGGLSRSIEVLGGVADIGPHVIGSDYARVNEILSEVMGRRQESFQLNTTMLWKGHDFSYPPKPHEILTKLGIFKTLQIGVSMAVSRLKLRSISIENHQEQSRKQYGMVLSSECIEPYLERLWGVPSSEICADWKPGRFIRSSIMNWVRTALKSSGDVHVSHPTHGMGDFYIQFASKLEEVGCEIWYESKVQRLSHDHERVTAIEFVDDDGTEQVVIDPSAQVVSTLPLNLLMRLLDPEPPAELSCLLSKIKFRSTILGFVIADPDSAPKQHIRYINDPQFKISRITNFNRWTSGMGILDNSKHLLCCEMWVDPESCWEMDDDELVGIMIRDLDAMGISGACDSLSKILRVPNTHPIITNEARAAVNQVHEYLNSFSNLLLSGRAGAFEYADQDRVLDLSIQRTIEFLKG